MDMDVLGSLQMVEDLSQFSQEFHLTCNGSICIEKTGHILLWGVGNWTEKVMEFVMTETTMLNVNMMMGIVARIRSNLDVDTVNVNLVQREFISYL